MRLAFWRRPLPAKATVSTDPIDVLYLASNRIEFTKATLTALMAATRGYRLVVYVDRDSSHTIDFVHSVLREDDEVYETMFGSPVAILNDFLEHHSKSAIFAKIDNDLLLCPGWLDACLLAISRQPEYDLVGIEPQGPSWALTPAIIPAGHIGGVGLMRRRAFEGRPLPKPNGFFGFTGWQMAHPSIRKGWLVPSLPIFLLDHVPLEPWASYSREYRAKKWQRQPWVYYAPEFNHFWKWWTHGVETPPMKKVWPDQEP